jgi:hypothetical protein
MNFRRDVAGAADFRHAGIFRSIQADGDSSRAIADAVRRDPGRGIDCPPVPTWGEGGTSSYFTTITVQGENLVSFWEALPRVRPYRLENPMKAMIISSNFRAFPASARAHRGEQLFHLSSSPSQKKTPAICVDRRSY